MDYPNHYLTHPAPWDSPEAVAAILYFDHEESAEVPPGRCLGTGPRMPPTRGLTRACLASGEYLG